MRFLISLTLIFGLTMGGSLISNGQTVKKEQDNAKPHVIEITAVDYAFITPDTIPSGWTRFRMTNKGTENHFFYLFQLPKGRTFTEWRITVREPVDSIIRLADKGKIDSVKAALDRATPDWGSVGNLEHYGGLGLIAPGRTGQTTYQIEPGHYLMICTIETPSGRSHASVGMIDGFTVVESSSDYSPPESDATVRSVGREIHMEGTLSPGTQTVKFHVDTLPEGLGNGSDKAYYTVWLVRLSGDTSTEDVLAWDFQNPAPYEGLGGIEYISRQKTTYITADLESGRYAWYWGYDQGDQDFLKAFSVE